MVRSHPGPASDTRGATPAEVLVALLLGLLVGTLALGTLARARTLVEAMARRGEALDAVRTARHLLAWELASGAAEGEGGGGASDTLAVRGYRGAGAVCPGSVHGSTLAAAAQGVRSPDPGKDSARIVSASGGETVLAVVDVAPSALARARCPGAGTAPVRTWSFSAPPPPDAVLVVYFERGSYHLRQGALRYRRGAGGRQPLTAEALATPPSHFERWGESVAVRLHAPVFPGLERRVVPAWTP